jgi:hypothetical protein
MFVIPNNGYFSVSESTFSVYWHLPAEIRNGLDVKLRGRRDRGNLPAFPAQIDYLP